MRNRISCSKSCQETVRGGEGPDSGTALSLTCEGRAGDGLSGSAALPSLNSNNSTELTTTDKPKLSPYTAKRSFTVRNNAARFIREVGLERVGFLTLTFPDRLFDWRIGSKRFNSVNTHLLPLIFGSWQRVFERTSKGYVHYHLLVDCLCDIRTGFDFDLYLQALALKEAGMPYRHVERQAFRTANLNLKNFWQILREKLPDYGFGRHELLPIRTTVEAASAYVSKYVSKDMETLDQDKGVRRISYSQGQLRSSTKFSWNTPGGKEWRRKLQLFCHYMGFVDEADIKARFGPKWAFRMADAIMDIEELMLGVHRGQYVVSGGVLVCTATGEELF